MHIKHKLSVIIGGVAIVMGTGTVAAIAATQSHDPNVVGGRFCVSYGSNTVHYDWDNLPCPSGEYLDQNTYSEPVVLPPVVVNPQVTRTNRLSVDTTNPGSYQVTIPSGATLNSILAVTWEDGATEVSVPFTAQVTNDLTGAVTLTFVGTPAQTPPLSAAQNIYVTYSYTPQG